MKQYLLLFITCICVAFPCLSQDKLALLVAVGQYPENSRIRPIASVTDLKYIKAALKKNGFSDNNMQTLVNAKATKQGILNSLAALATRAKKNDIVVISFGCHGQQIRDQRTAELGKDEDDGYDEALIPYDAKGVYNPTGYHGEKHLRDDDLFPLLTEIRKKIGQNGSMLVLIDACHSGTGTRADDFPVSRGEPEPFPDPENPFDPASIQNTDTRTSYLDHISDSISNMVVISGSGPHQLNKQVLVKNEEVGSLSWAFYKAMNELEAGNDYGILFQKIKATIQAVIPEQLPMVEGNTSQVIFSGNYKPKVEQNFIRVGLKEGPRSGEDSVFTLGRGMLDRIYAGATGKIYLPGKTEPVAEARIVKAENFNSVGVAAGLLKRGETYELRFSEENYGNLSAQLRFDRQDQIPAGIEKQLRQALAPYKFIAFNEQNGDFRFGKMETANGPQIYLSDRNNKMIWDAPLSTTGALQAADQQNLIAGIQQALRVKYLRTMPDGGELEKSVKASIIPAVKIPGQDTLLFREGDAYALKIENNSTQKLFYTVLDIYPDNTVEVLYPYKGKEPSDYSIAKNGSVVRKLSVSANSPAGVEFLKIIVSKEPMDLRGVFTHSIQRDEMRSFQLMLDDLFARPEGGKKVRADWSSVKAEEIGIVTVNFTIMK
jgi:hypothetical protein